MDRRKMLRFTAIAVLVATVVGAVIVYSMVGRVRGFGDCPGGDPCYYVGPHAYATEAVLIFFFGIVLAALLWYVSAPDEWTRGDPTGGGAR